MSLYDIHQIVTTVYTNLIGSSGKKSLEWSNEEAMLKVDQTRLLEVTWLGLGYCGNTGSMDEQVAARKVDPEERAYINAVLRRSISSEPIPNHTNRKLSKRPARAVRQHNF
jgi:hypothetical protein